MLLIIPTRKESLLLDNLVDEINVGRNDVKELNYFSEEDHLDFHYDSLDKR